jgi:hypothetical protein
MSSTQGRPGVWTRPHPQVSLLPGLARLEAVLTLTVITFLAWAWETRDLADPLLPADYQVKITLAAAGGPYPSHF